MTTADQSGGSMVTRAEPWLIAAIPAIVAVTLGLWGISDRQLWRDELSTLFISGYPLSGLAEYVQKTDMVNAPYYVLIHFWTGLFGESELALRVPGVFGAALAAASTALIGRKLFNPATGLVAGLLFAILPAVSRYAQESRAYALTLGVVALSVLLLLRAVEKPVWQRWVLYSLTVPAFCLLNMVAGLVLLAHGVYVLLAWRENRDRRLLTWLVACAVGMIPVLPLIWFGSKQGGQVAWISEATFARLGDELIGVTGSSKVSVVIAGLALLGIWPLGRRSMLLSVWAFGPFIVLYLASPHLKLLIGRYLLFTLPAFCLLAALAIDRYTKTFSQQRSVGWQRVAVPVMAIVLASLLAIEPHLKNRGLGASTEPDMRGAAHVIAAEYQAGDKIGYQGGNTFLWQKAVGYYLPPEVRPATMFTAGSRKAPVLTSPMDGRLWLLNTDDPTGGLGGVEPAFSKTLDEHYTVAKTIKLQSMTVTLLLPKGTPSP